MPGVSENIRVVSIVDRFLEHSRIFYFAQRRRPELYIGSADWMDRNLDRRVECVIPVTEPDLTGRLEEILDVCWPTTQQAWELSEDGSWHRSQPARASAGSPPISGCASWPCAAGVEARSGAKSAAADRGVTERKRVA